MARKSYPAWWEPHDGEGFGGTPQRRAFWRNPPLTQTLGDHWPVVIVAIHEGRKPIATQERRRRPRLPRHARWVPLSVRAGTQTLTLSRPANTA